MFSKSVIRTAAVLAVCSMPVFAEDPNRPAQGQNQGQPITGQNDPNRRDRQGADWPMEKKREGQTAGNDAVSRQMDTFAQNPATAADRLFVLKASTANTCEVETARKALTKTQDPEIRRIAQMIIDDHTAANKALERAAGGLDVQLVTEEPSFAKQEKAILFSLPEEDFKKAYLSHLKAAHAMSISMYQDKAVLAKDAAVKQYVTETLPKLRHHGQMVTAAAAANGLPGSAVAGSDTGEIGDRR